MNRSTGLTDKMLVVRMVADRIASRNGHASDGMRSWT